MSRFSLPQLWALALGVGLALSVQGGEKTDSQDKNCRVYSLANWGNTKETAKLGRWLAKTIPTVVDPDAWDDKQVVSYNATSQILVVYQNERVQTQVASFLKKIKKSLPSQTSNGTRSVCEVVPASQYQPSSPAQCLAPITPSMLPGQVISPVMHTAEVIPTPVSTTPVTNEALKVNTRGEKESSEAYPVPAQKKSPKHLFHFIIRYEEEGIVDDNVVKAVKYSYGNENANNNTSPSSASASGTPAYPTSLPSSLVPPLPAVSVQENPPQGTQDDTDEEPKPVKTKTRVTTPAATSPVYANPNPLAPVATALAVPVITPEPIAAPAPVPGPSVPPRKTKKVVKNRKVN